MDINNLATSTQPTKVPRTRQRVHKAATPLDIPDINDDATERKRVLNVLAQRRYREKRRQDRKIASDTSASAAPERAKHRENEEISINETNRDESNNEAVRGEAVASTAPSVAVAVTATSTIATPCDAEANDTSWEVASDTSLLLEQDVSNNGFELDRHSSSFGSLSVQSPSSLQSLSSFDAEVMFDFSSTPSASPTDGIDLSFPDSFLLPINEYAILRAFTQIATRLGCKSNIFDLHALSPFADPTVSVSHLPQTWQPTTCQILIPHHPIMDFLPWASVREKILQVFTLPEHLRPPAAKDPTALVHFAHDIEDSAEGIRISGPDIYDPSSWEVGQALFERWWFIFDRSIIEQSNAWRERRGAPKLHVLAPGVSTGGGSIKGQYSAGLAAIERN